MNAFGSGNAYYIASRNDNRFNKELFKGLFDQLSIKRSIDATLPSGVTAQLRGDEQNQYVFLMNFTNALQEVTLLEGHQEYNDVLTGEKLSARIKLQGYGVRVLCRSLCSIASFKNRKN